MRCRCGTNNNPGFQFCESCGADLNAQAAAAVSQPLVLGLELMTKCVACWNPIPVNALVATVMCTRCNGPNETGWASLLQVAVTQAAKRAPGDQGTVTSRGGGASLTYFLTAPRCDACKTELALTAAFEQAHTTNGWAACGTCGIWLVVRAADQQMAPGALALIGEDPAQLPGMPTEMTQPKGARPVAFPCPACSGSLDVDGSSRAIVCKFCSTSAYLPDDLWQRLHPAMTPRRWYLIQGAAARGHVSAGSTEGDARGAVHSPVVTGAPRLEGQGGMLDGKSFPLGDKPVDIGRSAEVQIGSAMVARRHARVVPRDGGFWLEDLGSANGTQVNGASARAPHRLRAGDVIQIADEKLVVCGGV